MTRSSKATVGPTSPRRFTGPMAGRGTAVWGRGVGSFGHVNGVHSQSVDSWGRCVAVRDRGDRRLGRALPVAPNELLIREMILQLKTGTLDAGYFRGKFGVDPRER